MPYKAMVWAALLSFGTEALNAQDGLTKSERGKIAVSQCYSTCFEQAYESSVALNRGVEHAWDFLWRSGPTHQSDEEEIIVRTIRSVCALAQNQMRLMDGCHYGCVDLESVYGRQNTSVKTRFIYLIRQVRKPLEEAGLWNGYSDSPTASTHDGAEEFWDSCKALWENSWSRYVYEPVLGSPGRIGR